MSVTLPDAEEGDGKGHIRKTWSLIARRGDGPYTPAIAVRAACRDLGAVRIGAYPALGVVSLDQIKECFSDLNISTQITETRPIPPFKSVLGGRFEDLDDTVRKTHESVTPRTYVGQSTVTRGKGFQARISAALFGFPATGENISVSVSKTPTERGEVWVRQFGAAVFRSFLSPTKRGMSERFGLFAFDLDLVVKEGTLCFPVKSGRFLGIPVPRALLPISEAREYVEDEKFRFDVHLKSPTGATLVHYRGWLMKSE